MVFENFCFANCCQIVYVHNVKAKHVADQCLRILMPALVFATASLVHHLLRCCCQLFLCARCDDVPLWKLLLNGTYEIQVCVATLGNVSFEWIIDGEHWDAWKKSFRIVRKTYFIRAELHHFVVISHTWATLGNVSAHGSWKRNMVTRGTRAWELYGKHTLFLLNYIILWWSRTPQSDHSDWACMSRPFGQLL